MARLPAVFLAATLSLLSVFMPATASAGTGDNAINELIDCTANIVHSRKGEAHVLTGLASMLSDALRGNTSKVDMIHSVSQCHAFKQLSATSTPEDTNLYLAQIAELPVNKGIRKLFTGFVRPHHDCFQIGLNISSMYGIGFETSVDAAFCRSTMGHRWLEVRPSAELLLGLGHNSSNGLGYGWDTHVPTSDYAVSLTPVASIQGAFLLSGKLSSRGQIRPNTVGLALVGNRTTNRSFLEKYADNIHQQKGLSRFSYKATNNAEVYGFLGDLSSLFLSIFRVGVGFGGQMNITVLRLNNDYDYLYTLMHQSR